ncbi:hypothetical protein HYS99_01815 [Candidatus Giovannonibacteria bacterium]|nr:hypothetical protein [Candidatus Giovannonibacteria bacterium]
MKNVELVKGRCALCRGPIDEKWTEHPSLGTKCRDCSYKNPEPQVFGPENLEICVKKQVSFDPLFGVYDYYFEWAGTKVSINGKIGIVRSTQADCAWVIFDDTKRSFGEPIDELGYWDIFQIYKEAGGETEPPTLDLPEHIPQAVPLMEKPLIPLEIQKDRHDRIQNVSLRDSELRNCFLGTDLVQMFQAFCNTYVRFRFGLAQNLCCEGGFVGRNFEVRNSMGCLGISIDYSSSYDDINSVQSAEGLKTLAVTQELIDMTIEKEEKRIKKDRSKILVLNPSSELILSTWVTTLETLLKYDWRSQKYETIEDIWQCHCRIQDILLNIMPADILQEVLAFAKNNRAVHYGQSF